jgi:hypothetical protein
LTFSICNRASEAALYVFTVPGGSFACRRRKLSKANALGLSDRYK